MIPVRATATGGATLGIRTDRSLLAAGATPLSTVYTIVLVTPLSGITGLRLDVLSDASLPGSGPGRSDSGNFVLTELVADASALAAPSAVSLTNATATASQASYSVAEAINGVTTGANEGWAIDVGGPIVAQTAAFETSTTTATATNGSFVRATLQFTTLDTYYVGRFRIAGTTVDRAMFADGLASGGNVGAGAIWSPLTMFRAAATGLTFTPLTDGSILVSGTVLRPTYTVDLVTAQSGLTGVRLEALEDPSLPMSGPGSAGNGNFVLTEFQVAAAPF